MRPRVILRRCPDYDPERLRAILRDGLASLGFRARGRVLIKPNVVTANKAYIHDSYTRPEVIEALVAVLREQEPAVDLTVGESGGIGLPTRLFFHDSGYSKMAARLNVPLVDFNEQATVVRPLERAKWHKTVKLAKALHEADTKIWCPKLKFHIVTQITNALKLNIGILTHEERFLFHDDRLNEKVVDLLEPGFPDLVVTDAVVCGRGFESSPYPFTMGAVLMANDPLAADLVAARLLGYRPEDVLHLVEASARGYGSLDLARVSVEGDVGIDELAERTRGLESPFQDLQKLDTPLRFYEGQNKESGKVCFGGCICSVKGVLGTSERRYPGNLLAARKGAIVMGYYPGDVLHPGEPVALIGDCAGVGGRFEAGKVIRIGGCPVAVKDLMLRLLFRFGMKSPVFDAANLFKLAVFSLVKAWMRLTIPWRKRARIAPG